MPRLPRIQIEGAIYYVTSKGLAEQHIFKEESDYEMYLNLMKKYKGQYKFRLFSYCLAPDELHLLIETREDATLSDIMHDLNSMYTKYFNSRYERSGPLFESRFRSVFVEKAKHLLEMTRYVHGRPKEPKGYPYSSFDIYLMHPLSGSHDAGRTDKKVIGGLDLSSEVEEVLTFLKQYNNQDLYESYCLQGDEEETRMLKKLLKRGSILGSDSFIKEVHSGIEDFSKEQKAEVESRKWAKPNKILIFMIGFGILVTSSSSLYLYISKGSLRKEYKELLQMREDEFARKTRFENISPIALTELEGTEWEIEMVPSFTGKTRKKITDKIKFHEGLFSSGYFLDRGFTGAPFKLTSKGAGATLWEAVQSNPKGETVSWSGDWIGDVMRGKASYQPKGQAPQEFSFFSLKWSYLNETVSYKPGVSNEKIS